MPRIPSIFLLLILLSTASAATTTTTPAPSVRAAERKTKTIQAQIRTENWNWYGDGKQIAASLPSPPQPEKFERFKTPPDQPPTFTGTVLGIPPGKRAHVTVVANVGTQWIDVKNYKAANVAADGTFTITADHVPTAIKSLAVNVDGGISHFLPAEFAPRQSAKNIELRIPETRTIVLSMDDPQGKNVRNFRVEVFTAFSMQDDAGRDLRMQRLFAGASAGGAIVFDVPAAEPIGVLLSAPGLAPYYEIIDPRDADEFHFKMLPASRIKGIVTRDGQPVAGEQILLFNRTAPLSETARKTDAQGRFDFPGRVPGQQHIHVAGYQTTLEVQPGETTVLTLEIGAAATPPAGGQ